MVGEWTAAKPGCQRQPRRRTKEVSVERRACWWGEGGFLASNSLSRSVSLAMACWAAWEGKRAGRGDRSRKKHMWRSRGEVKGHME